MQQWREIMKNISMLAQLGLSLVIPILACIGVCWLLVNKLQVGAWVYVVGILMGLGGSAMTGYKYYLLQVKQTEKEQKSKKKRVSFNSHL